MAHTREKKDACAHDWEPWFTVVDRASLCFFYPGARCTRCKAETPCMQDPLRALTAFKKRFGISFDTFAQEHEQEIADIMEAKGCKGWRIARPEDYRFLSS